MIGLIALGALYTAGSLTERPRRAGRRPHKLRPP